MGCSPWGLKRVRHDLAYKQQQLNYRTSQNLRRSRKGGARYKAKTQDQKSRPKIFQNGDVEPYSWIVGGIWGDCAYQ